MKKSIISEGKTTNEAIEKGLKELNVSKDRVDIKVLENDDKRSFFSILTPMPKGTTYDINSNKSYINVSINNENLGFLIGYRGETLYSMQNILTAIAGKGIENKIRVILDIQGYKAKREKTLEELAEKVARTVIKTKKSVKLEPMQAYERKIIHSKLQENSKVETTSIGEEPNRRIVVSLKANK